MTYKTKPIKLVVSDLDGTLLDQNRKISAEAIHLIDHLKERDIGFTFITGRPYIAVTEFAARAHITLPIVTCNGAEIVQDGRVIFRQSMPLMPLRETMLKAMEIGSTVLFYHAGIEYALAETPWVKIRRERGKVYPQPKLSEFFWATQVAEKVTIINDSLKKTFSSTLQVNRLTDNYTVCSYENSGCEIMSKGIDKGEGIKRLSGLLQVQPANILAIGDSENDIEMFQVAGVGAAVANATDFARVHADYLCDRERTDGVIEAIRYFCLNRGK